MTVYRIKKSDDFRRQTSSLVIEDGAALNNQPQQNKNIFTVEEYKSYPLRQKLNGFPYGYEPMFENVQDDFEAGIQRLHVDNRGNVIFIHTEKEACIINNNENWETFKGYLNKFGGDFDKIEFMKFGQGAFCIKAAEQIFWVQYNDKALQKIKEIKHKALDMAGECDLDNIYMPRFSKFIIFIYEIREVTTIIVWDTENDIEHSNFLGRKGDNFVDYIVGTNSKLGFACFDKYTVDLDICVPIPFMAKKNFIADHYRSQGIRISTNEDILLSDGTVVTPVCHRDIYYWRNKSLENLDPKKIVSILTLKPLDVLFGQEISCT